MLKKDKIGSHKSKGRDIQTGETSFKSQTVLSLRRDFLRILPVLTPIVLLVVLEISLRIFGYGVNMDLFTEFKSDNRFLTMNPEVSKKYFTNPEDATHGLAEIFRKEKAPESIRVFVLGASTAIGYPFTANGAFSRWLKYRLMMTFPDKEIEVINLSLTAVNSYAALDFAKQIPEYNPDAVIIYLGHNEYYGALGVGSTSKLGNNIEMVRFLTSLRELRIVQLINNMNQKTNNEKELNAPGRNLMKEMAGNNILRESDQFKKGIEQFQANMDDILRILSRKNIPTIVSTLVSNEKSLKPFVSDTADNEFSAEYFFERATGNYHDGDFILAKEQFVKAKDLDLLRYRAPEEMNGIITELTEKYPNVYLADTKKIFENLSEQGIPGNEMLMDHVHPYLYGQGLIAESFYISLKENEIIHIQDKTEMTFSELLEEMPITVVDSLKGTFLMNLSLKEWPFNMDNAPVSDTMSSLEAELANKIVYDGSYWYQTMDLLLKFYQQNENWTEALKVAEASTLVFPYEEDSYLTCYRMSIKQYNLQKAEFHLHKAFQLNPGPEKARSLFSLNMDLDDTEAAMTYLDFLIEMDPVNKYAYNAMKGNLDLISNLKSTYENDPGNIEIINALAGMYVRLGYKYSAKKYLEIGMKSDPHNNESLTLLKQTEALQDIYH